MRSLISEKPGSHLAIYFGAIFLAVLAGASIVLAPVLLALPVLIVIGVAILYVARRYSSYANGSTGETWPANAQTTFWILVISLPSIVAFDQTGFTKDQGLFNPQSIGRILLFVGASVALTIFWAQWSRSSLRQVGAGLPRGVKLVLGLYGWYLLTAPFVISGTPLALAIFRSLEWLVATGLIAMLIAAQNAQGQNDFAAHLKIIVPMLFFLMLSNLFAWPIVPGMIYSTSLVTGTSRLGGLFTHPNLLALVTVLLCAYALAYLSGWRRVVLALVSVATLFLTYSRGGFAMFALSLVFAIWFLAKGLPARLVVMGGFLVAALAIWLVPGVGDLVLDFLARGNKTESLGTLSERTAVWEAGKILIARSPWLGSGFIAGPKQLADVMIDYRLSTNFAAPHAHNEFLQAQISGGPVALVLSLLIQLRIAVLLFVGEGLATRDRFFGWVIFGSCAIWGLLQPSLSYFLYLPGVLLIWLLIVLEELRSRPVLANHSSRQQAPSVRATGPKHTTASLLALCIGSCLAVSPNDVRAAAAFESNTYVTVSNGHLAGGDQRLRVWGVNLQSGAFKTYSEIDALITRLDALGFNAIRLWPTGGTFYSVKAGMQPTLNASAKGDGSDLDRFDYLVAAASRHGIHLQMTMLHYFDLPFLRASRDPAVATMIPASANDAMLRRVHGFAPYVSAGYRERLKSHMQRMLLRTNPYTGRRYADEPAISTWELANEAPFVTCAVDPSCLRQLPPAAIQYLSEAWKQSPHNSGKSALPVDLNSITQPSFYRNYSRFVADQFIAVSTELRDFARQVGGAGSGVAVQPFIFNTDPGERSALSHYAYGAGDVFSASAYSSPLSKDKGYAATPWLPYVAGSNPIPFLEYVKVKDKPFIMYEGSFFRPYPFRAEWGVVIAAIALKQDWDGAFLYTYGQPGVIYDNDPGGIRYGNRVLPDPVPGDKGERGHYAYSFHHGGDPITMASWGVGGQLFLGGTKSTVAPDVVWDIPIDNIFRRGSGYPAPFTAASNLVELPRKKSMAVRFTDSEPVCNPCVSGAVAKHIDTVDWDTNRRRLTIQTAGGKAIAGEISGPLGVIAAGISAQAVKAGFGVVAVTGKAGAVVKHLTVIGDAENSGRLFDPTRVDFGGPTGAMVGMVTRGSAPLQYSGPDVRFMFTDSSQLLSEIGFDMNTIKQDIGAHYLFSSTGRVFEVDVSSQTK